MIKYPRLGGTVPVLLLLDAALAIGLSLATDRFATPENLMDLVIGASFQGTLAVGLLVVLLAGGLDISFTAQASIAQYLLVIAMARFDVGWVGAFAIAGGIGLILGLANGLLVGALGVSPIIVTISTLNIMIGLLVWASGGEWLYDFPDWFGEGLSLHLGSLRVPMQVWVFALITLFVGFVLRRAALGRLIIASGADAESARRQGVSPSAIRLIVYGFMGICAGTAGLTQAQLVLSVAPNAFVGRELDVLATAVLGGASLTGGRGTVTGTLLALVSLALLGNGFTLLGVSSYWFQAVTGLVVIGGVAVMVRGRAKLGSNGGAV